MTELFNFFGRLMDLRKKSKSNFQFKSTFQKMCSAFIFFAIFDLFIVITKQTFLEWILIRKKLVVDGIEPTITRSRANRENRSTSSTSPSYWIVVIYRYGCTKQVGCSWYAGLGEQATRCWSPMTDCAYLYILLRRLSQTDQTWAQTSVQKVVTSRGSFFLSQWRILQWMMNETFFKIKSQCWDFGSFGKKRFFYAWGRRNEQNVFAQK